MILNLELYSSEQGCRGDVTDSLRSMSKEKRSEAAAYSLQFNKARVSGWRDYLRENKKLVKKCRYPVVNRNSSRKTRASTTNLSMLTRIRLEAP
jgi:hypothetical protein